MSFTYLGHQVAQGRPLPLYSFRVPAGFPSPAQDHIERDISLDELLGLRLPQTFLIRVEGNSMCGAGIFDNDIAVVDRAIDPRPGMIVVASLNAEPLVKTLCKEGTQVILRSENPEFAPRYIFEADDLVIWGVVHSSVRMHTHVRT